VLGKILGRRFSRAIHLHKAKRQILGGGKICLLAKLPSKASTKEQKINGNTVFYYNPQIGQKQVKKLFGCTILQVSLIL